MSSRKSKLAIIAAVVAILGVVIFFKEREYIKNIETAAGPKDEKWLFPIPLEDVGAIEVMRKGQLHRFEKDEKGTWFYHGQQDGPNATEHAHRADPRAETLHRPDRGRLRPALAGGAAGQPAR